MLRRYRCFDIFFMFSFVFFNVLVAQLTFSPLVNRFISPFDFSLLGFLNSIIADTIVLFIILNIGLLIFKRKSKLFLALLIITFILNMFAFTVYIYSNFFSAVFSFSFSTIDQPADGFTLPVILFVLNTFFLELRLLYLLPFFVLLVLYVQICKKQEDVLINMPIRKKINLSFSTVVLLFITVFINFQVATSDTQSSIDPDLFSVKNGGFYSFYIQRAIGIEAPSADEFTQDELEGFIFEFNKNQSTYTNLLDENEYSILDEQTGIFQNKNLFVIQMESFSSFLIDLQINGTYVTPFLNNLAQEHVYFSNVFQTVGRGNTNDAELSFLTGLIGKRDDFVLQNVALDYQESNLVLDVATLPSLFGNIDYETLYFHGNTGEFFTREVSHEIMGFNQLFFIEDFFDWRGVQSLDELSPEEVDGNFPWISDRAMLNFALEKAVNVVENDDNFLINSVLVQPHVPFRNSSNLPTIDWGHEVTRNDLVNYLDRVHYIDAVLGEFIEVATKALPDTLFILYADHGPVLRSNEFRNLLGINSTIEETLALFGVPVFFIDNTVEDVLNNSLPNGCEGNLSLARSQRDIFRTVVNMWNLWDNVEYIFGVNMFSSEPSIVYDARLGYFLTDDIFANLRNISRRIQFNPDVTEEQMQRFRSIINKHRAMNNHFINTRRS